LNRFELIQAQTLENALSDLKSDRPIDLVISAWDYQEGLGRRLLTEVARLRSAGQIVPPLIVFTSANGWPTRRLEALGLGAAEYTWQWEQLFPAIEQILSPRQYPDS
jgi:DNA-binding response OmpR family regulator